MGMPADPTSKAWYVMRALYGHEQKAQAVFDNDGIESFIPMTIEEKTVRGKKTTVERPAVNNLIFVHASRHELEPYMKHNRFLQFIFGKGGRQSGIMTIPDKLMHDFITLSRSRIGNPLFLTDDQLTATRGTHVRVTAGPLEGVEGTLMKISGTRSKRLVVQLRGIAAVASEVPQDQLEESITPARQVKALQSAMQVNDTALRCR